MQTMVESEYLSAGANRHTAVADWSHDGRVAFGADSNIAIWRPHDSIPRGVTSLLSGHKDVVKAVKFLPGTDFLLSGSDDHCLRIWALAPGHGHATCVQTLEEHVSAVNCIEILPSDEKSAQGDFLFVTGAADASFKIWSFNGKEAQVLQTIKPSPKFFPLALAISSLDRDGHRDDTLVLAVAGTRDIIQIFVAESTSSPHFELQATLTGHEGWIRSLDFAWETNAADSDLILASASQDKYIRLWRLHRGTEIPAPAAANGGDPSLGAYLPGKSPSNKAHKLKAGGQDFTVTFEALLLGHDDWIYSAKWYTSSIPDSKLQLLSTSADNTLAIWEADPASGIWVTSVRLGEISREKGATTATGSTGGFWTGLWSPDGKSVTCLGRTGSWRLWDHDQASDQWNPRVGITGHTRPVTGIAWAEDGDYLLSTSSDQTTRLHASWKRDKDDAERQPTWHEMARPQIHGYDLNCIDVLGKSQFVSGADEKLMRVFDEPKAVARLLSRLCGIGSDGPAHGIEAMPDAANMPVLGLSNKAIDIDENNAAPRAEGADANTTEHEAPPPPEARRSALETTTHPPLEDSLSRHTLWPEAEKLYGHGYELSCLAASHDGRLIASACKASSINHAVIRIFETQRWTEVRPPLTAHSLTVTRLRFSADDRYLLSVGRDRQWAVFARDDAAAASSEAENGDGEKAPAGYRLLQSNPKGHTRMILDAAWVPPLPPDSSSASSLVFATAGRDKQVKVWRRTEDAEGPEISCVTAIAETHPVTAVDFKRGLSKDGNFVLAVGNEVGRISIHSICPASLEVGSSIVLPAEFCLARSVLQLAWRPRSDSNELAIAGEDSSLRVYSVVEK